ncbi:MAG: hypothetical protein ACLRI9_07750 [Bacteroides fragilis]
MTAARVLVHGGSPPAVAPHVTGGRVSRRSGHPVAVHRIDRIAGNNGGRRCAARRRGGGDKQRKGGQDAECRMIRFHTYLVLSFMITEFYDY